MINGSAWFMWGDITVHNQIFKPANEKSSNPLDWKHDLFKKAVLIFESGSYYSMYDLCQVANFLWMTSIDLEGP